MKSKVKKTIIYFNKILDFGDGGASIYPAENAFEISSKFGFSDIPQIDYHQDLDDDLLRIMEQDIHFPKNFPHDFIAFQLIDMSFWFRHMMSDSDHYEELLSVKQTALCPCFQKKLFQDVFKLNSEFVEIEREEVKSKHAINRSKSAYKSLVMRKTFDAKATSTPIGRIKSEVQMKNNQSMILKRGGISELGRKLTVFIKKK